MPRFPLLLCGAALALAACSDTSPSPMAPSDATSSTRGLSPGTHVQYGVPTKLGEGMVRTYLVMDEKSGRTPIELGIAIDARALEGTLTGIPQAMSLPLPAQAPAPYDFALFDWNPQGHEPPGVYDVPHFDFHFYLTPESAVQAIDPANPGFAAQANNVPTGDEVPPGYILLMPPGATPADIAVPFMGVHWLDVHTPEIQNLLGNPAGWAPFTKTFIYGSWNGDMTFVEPMVTRAYLLGQPSVTTPISVPSVYPESGWYPTAYRVYYDAVKREYRVAITGFVWRDA